MNPAERHHHGDHGYTTLGELGRVPKADKRLAAVGEIEEAAAAIGAALPADPIPAELDALLRELQDGLAGLAERLPASGNVGCADPFGLAAVDAACHRYHAGDMPARFAAACSASSAAGMLKLARTVTRRAERALWTLAAEEPADAEPPEFVTHAAVFLNRVSDLLLAVAFQIEQETAEHVMVGWC